MTAEVAILNMQAIALAADSAVTIGESKTFQSVNKLFELSKYEPIGVMIFGNASIMNVPWETIIKIYRKKLGRQTFESVKDYASHFVNFLKDDNDFFPQSQQERVVKERIVSVFTEIREVMSEKIKNEFQGRKEAEKSEVILKANKMLCETIEGWEDSFDMYKHFHEASTHVEWSEKFVTFYRKIIDDAKSAVFENLELTEENIKKLDAFLVEFFGRNIFIHDETGIVIAGFGTTELFPSLIGYRFDCKIHGLLRFEESDNVSISFERNAAIRPFAQAEMVHTFCRGIDPSLLKEVDGALKSLPEILYKYLDENFSSQRGSNSEKISDKVLKEVKDFLDGLSGPLSKAFDERSKQAYLYPLLNNIASLPPSELAEMAESLVNLTSFKRKVTADVLSVGGPIDVALISKGDGFIWVKRKHYFNANLNPGFFRRENIDRVGELV